MSILFTQKKEFFMKSKCISKVNQGLGRGLIILALVGVVLVIVGCEGCDDPNDPKDPYKPEVPAKYKDFYNYPVGRTTGTGTLKITNLVASPALLFTDSVAPSNYIGTVESLNSVKVRLPEQKFYTIVAVDRETWEERGDLAAQYSELTYFSNAQPYSISVTASNTWGGGTWYIYNQTNYWVSFKKSDKSGIIYAVAPPNALRFSVPVEVGKNIDYLPSFYKELKYDGKVIALVESDMPSEVDTVVTSVSRPTFTTTIGGQGIQPPGTDIKPAIFVSSTADRSVRVFSGQNNQLSAIGMLPGEDFAIGSGDTQMFTDLTDGLNTNSINFLLPDGTRVNVAEDITMEKNKVYRIVLGGTRTNGYTTTVTVQEASTYFN
jgi:hypothetical protein